MAFNLPKSPFNLNLGGGKKTKAKPFVDPGMPKDFTPIAPGTSDQIITPYKGSAFVGTTGGGKRQPVGKEVTGVTENTRGNDNKFVKGIVQPKSVVGSKQTSVIEGATIEQPKYRPSKKRKIGGKKASPNNYNANKPGGVKGYHPKEVAMKKKAAKQQKQ